jgi:hypothetical protein
MIPLSAAWRAAVPSSSASRRQLAKALPMFSRRNAIRVLSPGSLNGDGRLDVRLRAVSVQLEIIEREGKKIVHRRIER